MRNLFLSFLSAFLTAIFIPLEASADDLRISYSDTFHLPMGATDPNEKDLQSDTTTNGDRFEFSYLFGDTKGVILGLGYGVENNNYDQVLTSSRSRGRFESRYSFYYTKVGYWTKLSSLFLVEVSLNLGMGEFSFNRNSGGRKNIENVYSAALDSKLIYPLEFKKIKLDILGGIGFMKTQVPDFSYEGEKYRSSEFSGDFYLSLGLGLRF